MRGRIHKSIVLFTAILILTTPFQSMAQRGVNDDKGNLQDAERFGEMDAENDVNTMKWLGCGCIGLAIGVGIAYFALPSPPQERLIGKSSDYVWLYTGAYKAKARSKQLKYSLIGCGITSTIAGIVGIVLAAHACSETACEPIDPSCGLE